jgi:hypothetical protein
MRYRVPLTLLAAFFICATNLFATPQIVTVSVTGSGADYSNLYSAVASISDASAAKPYVIFVYPGVYTGSNNGGALHFSSWPSYVSLRGADRESTILRGSYDSGDFQNDELMNFSGVQGVEVSNITIDGSAQMATADGDFNGAICVSDASIKFSHVRILNGPASFSPGFTLDSGDGGAGPCALTGRGDIIVEDSDIGPVVDNGGNWTFRNTTIRGTHNSSTDYIFAYARLGSAYSGNVKFIGSTIEARAIDSSPPNETAAIWLEGDGPGEIQVIGSTLIAINDVASPAGVTAAVYVEPDTENTTMTIVGSELRYASASGISNASFFGVYSEEGSSAPIHLRASSFHSLGSGGTRSDIFNASASSMVSVEATANASTAGGGGTTTADSRKGQFSSDLIVPLSAPTLGPVNGQIWIDTGTNKLCYRSGGTTRCLTGS